MKRKKYAAFFADLEARGGGIEAEFAGGVPRALDNVRAAIDVFTRSMDEPMVRGEHVQQLATSQAAATRVAEAVATAEAEMGTAEATQQEQVERRRLVAGKQRSAMAILNDLGIKLQSALTPKTLALTTPRAAMVVRTCASAKELLEEAILATQHEDAQPATFEPAVEGVGKALAHLEMLIEEEAANQRTTEGLRKETQAKLRTLRERLEGVVAVTRGWDDDDRQSSDSNDSDDSDDAASDASDNEDYGFSNTETDSYGDSEEEADEVRPLGRAPKTKAGPPSNRRGGRLRRRVSEQILAVTHEVLMALQGIEAAHKIVETAVDAAVFNDAFRGAENRVETAAHLVAAEQERRALDRDVRQKAEQQLEHAERKLRSLQVMQEEAGLEAVHVEEALSAAARALRIASEMKLDRHSGSGPLQIAVATAWENTCTAESVVNAERESKEKLDVLRSKAQAKLDPALDRFSTTRAVVEVSGLGNLPEVESAMRSAEKTLQEAARSILEDARAVDFEAAVKKAVKKAAWAEEQVELLKTAKAKLDKRRQELAQQLSPATKRLVGQQSMVETSGISHDSDVTEAMAVAATAVEAATRILRLGQKSLDADIPAMERAVDKAVAKVEAAARTADRARSGREERINQQQRSWQMLEPIVDRLGEISAVVEQEMGIHIAVLHSAASNRMMTRTSSQDCRSDTVTSVSHGVTSVEETGESDETSSEGEGSEGDSDVGDAVGSPSGGAKRGVRFSLTPDGGNGGARRRTVSPFQSSFRVLKSGDEVPEHAVAHAGLVRDSITAAAHAVEDAQELLQQSTPPMVSFMIEAVQNAEDKTAEAESLVETERIRMKADAKAREAASRELSHAIETLAKCRGAVKALRLTDVPKVYAVMGQAEKSVEGATKGLRFADVESALVAVKAAVDTSQAAHRIVHAEEQQNERVEKERAAQKKHLEDACNTLQAVLEMGDLLGQSVRSTCSKEIRLAQQAVDKAKSTLAKNSRNTANFVGSVRKAVVAVEDLEVAARAAKKQQEESRRVKRDAAQRQRDREDEQAAAGIKRAQEEGATLERLQEELNPIINRLASLQANVEFYNDEVSSRSPAVWRELDRAEACVEAATSMIGKGDVSRATAALSGAEASVKVAVEQFSDFKTEQANAAVDHRKRQELELRIFSVSNQLEELRDEMGEEQEEDAGVSLAVSAGAGVRANIEVAETATEAAVNSANNIHVSVAKLQILAATAETRVASLRTAVEREQRVRREQRALRMKLDKQRRTLMEAHELFRIATQKLTTARDAITLAHEAGEFADTSDVYAVLEAAEAAATSAEGRLDSDSPAEEVLASVRLALDRAEGLERRIKLQKRRLVVLSKRCERREDRALSARDNQHHRLLAYIKQGQLGDEDGRPKAIKDDSQNLRGRRAGSMSHFSIGAGASKGAVGGGEAKQQQQQQSGDDGFGEVKGDVGGDDDGGGGVGSSPPSSAASTVSPSYMSRRDRMAAERAAEEKVAAKDRAHTGNLRDYLKMKPTPNKASALLNRANEERGSSARKQAWERGEGEGEGAGKTSSTGGGASMFLRDPPSSGNIFAGTPLSTPSGTPAGGARGGSARGGALGALAARRDGLRAPAAEASGSGGGDEQPRQRSAPKTPFAAKVERLRRASMELARSADRTAVMTGGLDGGGTVRQAKDVLREYPGAGPVLSDSDDDDDDDDDDDGEGAGRAGGGIRGQLSGRLAKRGLTVKMPSRNASSDDHGEEGGDSAGGRFRVRRPVTPGYSQSAASDMGIKNFDLDALQRDADDAYAVVMGSDEEEAAYGGDGVDRTPSASGPGGRTARRAAQREAKGARSGAGRGAKGAGRGAGAAGGGAKGNKRGRTTGIDDATVAFRRRRMSQIMS